MNNFTVDDLALIGPDVQLLSNGITTYTVTSVEGLDAPAFRIGSYESPGQDGGAVGSAFYGIRPVTLGGVVRGADAASYHQARRDLAYACRIQRDSFGSPVLTRFTLTTLDDLNLYFYGQITNFSIDTKNPTFGKFMLSIQVVDPMLYGVDQITTGSVGVAVGGGVSFPLIFDPTIEFGTSSGGTGTINNFGNADVWPIIYLRGVLTNPSIYIQERGKYMSLNLASTSASDQIVIDMKNRTIINSNGNVSLISYKTTDSSWFSLPADSTSTFILTTSSTSDTGTYEVKANVGYLGI